ncbi:SAM-dependent methyltransferase [Actinoplanes sp. NPDC049265]|uniref:SAM-dependent methyltransferase n=1 Tax=Actinoplanes sp. NPDC049265 TaxID=3363902 RepID=UPI003724A628
MDDINKVVGALALATEQAALLRGALDSGFLSHFGSEATPAEVGHRTGLRAGRVDDLCVALCAIGVLTGADGRYRLSDTYAPLGTDGATLANQLRNAAVRERLYEQMFTAQGPTRYADLDPADRMAVAAGSTVVASSAAHQRALRQSVLEVPLWAEAMAAGGVRIVALGCGLAGNLLTVLRLYPDATGVGVDQEAGLLDRARQDAAELGMADRVNFVTADAGTFTDPRPFDMVFWSQFFFPAASRAKTLANVHHLLRPGGLLVVPVRPEPPAGTVNPALALRVLTLQGWDVPPVTAGELRAELAASGFEIPPGEPGNATTVIARRS